MSRQTDERSLASSGPDGELPLDRLAELVSSFISMMNVGNMSRLDIEYGELRLSLRANGDTTPVSGHDARTRVATMLDDAPADPIEHDGSHIVTAPMIGTFYAAPAPGDPAFVSVGDRIEAGQTIGIIEAMKIMNEIASDRAGTVVEVLAINSQSVEFGSPLVRITPSDT